MKMMVRVRRNERGKDKIKNNICKNYRERGLAARCTLYLIARLTKR